MNRFTKDFWNGRYENLQIGWDTGGPTSPFVELFKTIGNKNLKVLIPGCGFAHEGKHIFDLGFKHVYLLDVSELARDEFLNRNPEFPPENYLIEDFFTHEGAYDLILEQTFFCALEPQYRVDYAKQMHSLLKPGGKLKGVLFDTEFEKNGPPFGGKKKEYENYFKDLFIIKKMEPCFNSIKPRLGNELFINLQKPLN